MTDKFSLHAALVALALLAVAASGPALAVIDGVTGTSFRLTAKTDVITTPEGGAITIWGFANTTTNAGARAQYPGPTLIVDEGARVTITLVNELDMPVSIIFPGQATVAVEGGVAGLLTQEAPDAANNGGVPGSVTYTFVATKPGTYLYESGTRPDLQVEMGLFGVLIVRPALGANYAYNHADTRFDHEYLFLISEIDPSIHDMIDFGLVDEIDTTAYWPVYWFFNGRAAPDTVAAPNVAWLPTQPYNCLPRQHPGEKTLMRVVTASRSIHPFHHHGNHARIIARDGRLLESAPNAGPDSSYEVFTIPAVPGETVDAIFTWTGWGMGWDLYGHAPGDDPAPGEDPAWHGKPVTDRVQLPEAQNLTFGPYYSGSPYLGNAGQLPPGEGGMNPNSSYFFMWHSHAERELTNFDIFPGGMMTFMLIEPPGVSIP